MDNREQFIFIALIVLLSACNSGTLYRTGQEYQRQQCRDGPPSRFEECMASVGKSYEEYEQERKEGNVTKQN